MFQMKSVLNCTKIMFNSISIYKIKGLSMFLTQTLKGFDKSHLYLPQ